MGYVGGKEMKFVSKPWGHEIWITNNEKYCGKILFLRMGKSCSFHYHKVKDEVLYVQSGELVFTYGKDKKEIYLATGDSFHVEPGLVHQMRALSDTHVFEVSTQHFDEDSIRVEDPNAAERPKKVVDKDPQMAESVGWKIMPNPYLPKACDLPPIIRLDPTLRPNEIQCDDQPF